MSDDLYDVYVISPLLFILSICHKRNNMRLISGGSDERLSHRVSCIIKTEIIRHFKIPQIRASFVQL